LRLTAWATEAIAAVVLLSLAEMLLLAYTLSLIRSAAALLVSLLSAEASLLLRVADSKLANCTLPTNEEGEL